MKKSFNPNEIPQKEGQDEPKKLYRAISEHSKRLDDARGCAQKVGDLFTPILKVQRKKFREYCERLIFSDPILYGRKAEEHLWRKSYYDIVAAAKRLKKQEYTPEEIASIESHINSGIGFYHHFICKLHWDYGLDLIGTVDFITSETTPNVEPKNKAVVDWAYQSVHQSLIYLGDLCRYKLEIYPNWDSNLAMRYYSQALCLRPDSGMPHNQMGTLASNQNRILDAVYHYMRCLACKVTFEGTENNLQRLFEKSNQYLEKLPTENSVLQLDRIDHIKQFIARFLLLIDIWYFNKTVPQIYNLCHQTYVDLEECLSYFKPLTSESGDTTQTEDSTETDSSTPAYLSNELIFKIIVICLLCVSKLQSLQSHHLSTAVAFTLAIYSQLIQNVTSHIQQSVLSFPVAEKLRGKGRIKLKPRRRRKSINDSDDTDQSDAEILEETETSDESGISDNELHVSSSSEGEEEVNGTSKISEEKASNGKVGKDDTEKTILEILLKSRKINATDMLEIISEENLLQSVKILNDWLLADPEVLKSCAKNTRSLMRQITILLNLLNINLKCLKACKIDVNKLAVREDELPLSEDVILKGVEILKHAQRKIDWSLFGKNCMSVREESVLRIMKLVRFGKHLVEMGESGINYNDKRRIFECEAREEEGGKLTIEELEKQNEENGEIIVSNGEAKDVESKGQMVKMKHMGQLWLAAEVRALESRVRGKASLSPFLVLDCDALIKYTYMVKHLVNSRKFIVVVPSAVVSVLDDLKREKSEARDAIRWLESQFHQGNRFFRAQRPHEKAPLPFIKYPKKKDKEAFVYIHIIECCHHLAQQQKGAANLVTLLIGNQNVLSNGENREISYVGLAQSAGVELELITQFYVKWKKTAKGKR